MMKAKLSIIVLGIRNMNMPCEIINISSAAVITKLYSRIKCLILQPT